MGINPKEKSPEPEEEEEPEPGMEQYENDEAILEELDGQQVVMMSGNIA
jgi:hypothetical protein